MSVSNTEKRQIPTTLPGEILKDDFMPEFTPNAASMATAMGVSRQTVNEIL